MKSLKIPMGSVGLTIYSIISKLINLAVILLLTRHENPDFFDNYVLLQSNITLFIVLLGYAMSITITRYCAILINDKIQLQSFLKGMAILFTVITLCVLGVIFLNIEIITLELYGDTSLLSSIKTSLFLIFTSIIFEFISSILFGFKMFNKYGRVLCFKSILILFLSYLAFIKLDLNDYLIGLCFINLVVSIFLYFSLKERTGNFLFKPYVKIDWWKILAVFKNFSLPTTLIVSIESIIFWFIVFSIETKGNAGDLTNYGIFEKFMGIIIFIPRIISKISFVNLSETNQKIAQNKWIEFYNGLYVNTLGIIVIIVILGAFRGGIFKLYNLSILVDFYFILFLLVGGLQAINNYLIQTYSAFGKVWQRMVITIIWAITIFLFITSKTQVSLLQIATSLILAYSIIIIYQGVILLKNNKNLNLDI